MSKKCEYETAISKIHDLMEILRNRDRALWYNGRIDKRVKARLQTIARKIDRGQ